MNSKLRLGSWSSFTQSTRAPTSRPRNFHLLSTKSSPGSYFHHPPELHGRRRFSSLDVEGLSKINAGTLSPQQLKLELEKPTKITHGVAVSKEEGKSIYLDMQATTPVDPRVLDAMLPLFTDDFGNAHSKSHIYGREAMEMVKEARANVAALIGADADEVIFTSGATESNNLAIKGVARFLAKSSNPRKHIVTTVTEHKCVLDSCRSLEQEGYQVTYLPVQRNGLVDVNTVEKAIRPDTALVTVMFVNNEIGVIQPIADIGKICRSKGVWFHTDAAQGLGKIPINVNAMNIDLMSLSGHKVYGPKGVGAIYIRRRPRVRVDPILSGGGQERGIRSGTLATPLVVGFGEACKIAKEEMARDAKHVESLANRLYKGITSKIPEVYLNGDWKQRYLGNLNVSFADIEGESLLMRLKKVALSSGSACTSDSLEPSYVLRALGVDEELAHTSIRFGLGRFTTKKEVDYTIDLLESHVQSLREMSPLWEFKQEGIDLKSIQWTQDK